MSRRDHPRLEAAEDLYREWHQKHPREVVETTFDFPEQVAVVGNAVQIIYASAKWETKAFLYEHDFTSRPEVYAPVEGSRGTLDTKSLLGVDSFTEPLPLPILATAQRLTYHDGSREITTDFGGREPLLCSSLDKRTLVIFDETCLFFVRGGQMVVTERGIVK